jgi:hypothetical protein
MDSPSLTASIRRRGALFRRRYRISGGPFDGADLLLADRRDDRERRQEES